MPQIAFHLKICVEAEAFRIARLQPTPELLRQARLGQIRDVRGHTGHGQTSGGRVAYVVIIAATTTVIGPSCLPPDLLKRHVLGTMTGCGGGANRNGRASSREKGGK